MRQSFTEIRVDGFHIDVYGHVNNARYLEYLERGRWGFINKYFDKAIIKERQWGFIIVRVDIRYRSPAFFEDVLVVDTTFKEIGRVTTKMQQYIRRKSDEKLLAEAEVEFVLMDMVRLRPLGIKNEVKTFLETGRVE